MVLYMYMSVSRLTACLYAVAAVGVEPTSDGRTASEEDGETERSGERERSGEGEKGGEGGNNEEGERSEEGGRSEEGERSEEGGRSDERERSREDGEGGVGDTEEGGVEQSSQREVCYPTCTMYFHVHYNMYNYTVICTGVSATYSASSEPTTAPYCQCH